jgi:hypothetical protein
MINELDDTIRQLLIKAGGFTQAEVDVKFEIPNREWSAGISKPTLNCYLFDIRENRELRQHGMESVTQNGAVAFRQRPLAFFDLTYLITAWTSEVGDEHLLLWRVLHTLLRFEKIPPEYLEGSLTGLTFPIYARTAMPEGVLKSPGEFWTALENQIKPSLSYVVTLAVDRDQISVGPPVSTARLRFPSPSGVEERWVWFGGVVQDKDGKPVVGAAVGLEGRDVRANTDAEGRFRLRVPAPGHYTLVARSGSSVQRRKIEIPETRYDIAFSAAISDE